MNLKKIRYLIAAAVISFSVFSCGDDYTPKPKGYYRIDLPEKSYQKFSSEKCPFTFEYPAYAQIVWDTVFFDTVPEHPCWLNIAIPQLNGAIYMSYKELNQKYTLSKLIEDAHTLTFKHTYKAESIDEQLIQTPNNVFGIVYHVGGNAASHTQFFLTDSVEHYLRGALYFRSTPNEDSLAPVIKFVNEDIQHLINTLEWGE